MLKVVFLGTPDFAVPALKNIINSKHEVLAVVTQPDKPKGRSGKPVFSPVKEVAVENGIRVLQYNKIRAEGVEDLKSLGADIFVTCAYGQILSQEIIDIPRFGIINIHASLLPKYRGAAPIQWSILNGDEYTGVTIMKTEAGIDTGDIVIQESLKIGENETAGELFDRLSVLGSNMIIKALNAFDCGEVQTQKQNHAEATHVSMLKKEDGIINWDRSAKDIFNQVRGMNPWPCAYSYFNGKIVKFWCVEICQESGVSGETGTVLCSNIKDGIKVVCGNGTAIKIKELQLEGCKRMNVKDFLLGRTFEVGGKFSNA